MLQELPPGIKTCGQGAYCSSCTDAGALWSRVPTTVGRRPGLGQVPTCLVALPAPEHATAVLKDDGFEYSSTENHLRNIERKKNTQQYLPPSQYFYLHCSKCMYVGSILQFFFFASLLIRGSDPGNSVVFLGTHSRGVRKLLLRASHLATEFKLSPKLNCS